MTNDQRETRRKLRILHHAEATGNVCKTPPEICEKVLLLRRKYHLGPIRIVWYLQRYHGIQISDAGVYRILKRNGLNRLLGGTRVRNVHTKRYNKYSRQWTSCKIHHQTMIEKRMCQRKSEIWRLRGSEIVS